MISISGPQIFDWLVSLVNFGVMFALFRLVVIIPMEQAVKLREQRVRLRLQEIDDIARDAKAKQESFGVKFGNVEAVLEEIRVASERSLVQTKAKIDEKADAEERYLLEKAKVESEAIRREVETEIRGRIASQAVARAEAMLSGALDGATQNAIASAGVKKVGELSAS